MRRNFEIGQTINGFTVIRQMLKTGIGQYEIKCMKGHIFSAPCYRVSRMAVGKTQLLDCPKCQDLTGSKIGRLTIIAAERNRNHHGKILWRCRCECGRVVKVSGVKLRNGSTASCGRTGCKIGTSHGLSKKSSAYNRWKSMLSRCYNPRNESFSRYGARGIRVCERWHSFENFLVDMGEPPKGTVLDRVDFNRDYTPSNCRWSTFKQSTQNRSNTVWVGSSRVLELSKLYGIPASRIYQRLRSGWSLKEIINIPSVPHGYNRKNLTLHWIDAGE